MRNSGLLSSVASIISALLLVTGCGEDEGQLLAPVSGTIKYHGKPLSHGQILMIDATGRMASSEIQDDGRYQLHAPIGENRVMIQCTDEPNLSKRSPRLGRSLRQPKSLIPNEYSDYVSSGLIMNVVDGNNEQDWNLSER